MPASTKHGSRVGPEVYSTFYFAILEAHEFAQSVTDKTEVDLLSKYSSGEVFKSAVTTYANGIFETYEWD